MPTRVAPTVLIVGGGFAGRSAARNIRDHAPQAHLVLVDDKPFFEFTPSILRCIIYPPHLDLVTFAHEDDYTSFILGRVTHITESEATVARPVVDGHSLVSVSFDYCIWATGVSFSRPVKTGIWREFPSLARRRAELVHYRNAIRRAREILIIGGGPIGVELAAELAGVRGGPFPKITLASPRILPRFPRAAGVYAKRWLTKRSVQVLCARLKPSQVLSDGVYEYEDDATGVRVVADLVFDCTGARSNGAANALIAGGVCSSRHINPDGSVSVLETLQLHEAPHFFVAGDAGRVEGELVMDGLAGEKTAYAAAEAGALAARNVTILMQSEALTGRRNAKKLKRFPQDAFPFGRFPRLFVISLHKDHGVLCVGPLVITGSLPAVIKVLIESLGVRCEKGESLIAPVFRIIEGLMYILAVAFTAVAERFRRPAAD